MMIITDAYYHGIEEGLDFLMQESQSNYLNKFVDFFFNWPKMVCPH